MASRKIRKLTLERQINRFIGLISLSEIESNRELRKKIVRIREYLEALNDPNKFLLLQNIDLKYGDYN